jgi:hypothetical protein
MNQKQNLRRLRSILKMFDPEDFYVISISCGSIVLQGEFNPKIVINARQHKFTFQITDSGYSEFRRGKYIITLT